jgi:tryptophanyl-tRNA synthetase
MIKKGTVFSGIQPTGLLHLGNLIGAIDLWKDLQHKFSTVLFCIVDLHSITADPMQKKEDALYTAACYLACGLDPKKSTIFLQSSVGFHAELCWLLGCITPIGWLNRMTQFKEKSGKNKEKASLGLYSYPVLMSADILLYNANFVPVGQDQTQHVELCRNIAQRFNQLYNTEHFSIPEVIKNQNAARVMSLRDGLKKMSKSDTSDASRINITDSKELIVKKIKAAKTDSVQGFDPENIKSRPEVFNLMSILSHITKKEIAQLCSQLQNCAHLKTSLADAIIGYLDPIQSNLKNISQSDVLAVLKDARQKARDIAFCNIKKIKNLMGFFDIS